MDETEAPLEATGNESANLLGRVRGWVERNNRLFGIGLIVTAIATVAGWLAMAEIAVQPETATIPRALEALDAGEDDVAHAIVKQIQASENLTAEQYGGAFFVLGTLKSREAERQWSPERSRAEYFVASKYLDESRSFGFPEGRTAEGLFLLGKALIESRQLPQGVEMLRRALDAGARGEARAHLLLAEAHFYAPEPDYRQAIVEIDAGVASADVTGPERAAAMLRRAEALAALGQADESAQAVESAGAEADPARRALVTGKAEVARLESAAKERASLGPIATKASAALEKARRLDKLSTSVSEDSGYLKARIAELIGSTDTALEGYREVRRRDGSSQAGIAAAIAEARIHQDAGEDAEALESYRRAIDEIRDRRSYRSSLLPFSDAVREIRMAHKKFLEAGRYESALALSERVGSLLGHTERLALRASTLLRWGTSLLENASTRRNDVAELLREGRRHLREAGAAYEQLAEARFASREFTDNLWTASEAFVRGQAYGEAIRVIERYLRQEPVQRNALALLRLGDAHLARGSDSEAIAAYEECLEFHENDASSYKARLNCAIAYREKGDFAPAEELLLHNLTRSALSPSSPEWRDSKFELGRIFAEDGKHDAAIRELEEAIARYPDAEQSRSARYQIAEAHRHAAQEPLTRWQAANTVNERERSREEAVEHLEAALVMYKRVQNEITLENSGDELDRVTLRNCFSLAGEVLFELERYDEAIQSFSSVSTLYQNEPYMLEALVHIYYCWRRMHDRPKALGVIQQAKLLLDRLPPDSDFATSTNLGRAEWDRLLTQLAVF